MNKDWKWKSLNNDENNQFVDMIYNLIHQENLDVNNLNDIITQVEKTLQVDLTNKETLKEINKMQYKVNEYKDNEIYQYFKENQLFEVVDLLINELEVSKKIDPNQHISIYQDEPFVLTNQDFDTIIDNLSFKFPHAFNDKIKKHLLMNYEVKVIDWQRTR